MPHIFGFPDLIDQDRWWQPARENVLKLWQMEPEHRARTHAFLLRQIDRVMLDYTYYHQRQLLANNIETPFEMGKSESIEWLTARPLMQALAGKQVRPAATANLNVTVELIVPDVTSFHWVGRGFCLIDFGSFHLSRLWLDGERYWEYKNEKFAAFPFEEVARQLSLLNIDPLSAIVLAYELQSWVIEWTEPAMTFLNSGEHEAIASWEQASKLEHEWQLRRDESEWRLE